MMDKLEWAGRTNFSWNMDLPLIIDDAKDFCFERDVFKINNLPLAGDDFSAQMFWKRELKGSAYIDKVSMFNAPRVDCDVLSLNEKVKLGLFKRPLNA